MQHNYSEHTEMSDVQVDLEIKDFPELSSGHALLQCLKQPLGQ